MAKSTLIDDGLTLEIDPEETPGQSKIKMRVSGVNAGTYTSANLTVDAYGRITAATSGSGEGGGGTGDMTALIYDPAGVAEQLVGLTASQVLTNKTINGVVLTDTGDGTLVLLDDGTYGASGIGTIRFVLPTMSQAEIQLVLDGAGHVYFEPGLYTLPLNSPTNRYCLRVHSNTLVEFAPGAELKLADGQFTGGADVGDVLTVGVSGTPATNVVISGGIVNGNRDGQTDQTDGGRIDFRAGIKIFGPTNKLTIRDVHVANCCGDGIALLGAVTFSENILIVGNLITNCREGIVFILCDGITVAGNFVREYPAGDSFVQDGIEPSGCVNFVIDGNVISDIPGIVNAGIDCWESSYGIIANNVISGCANGISLAGPGGSTNNVVRDNLIRDFTDGQGIEVTVTSPHNSIIGNEIVNGSNRGIDIGAPHIKIDANRIMNCADRGIRVTNAIGCSIQGNTIRDDRATPLLVYGIEIVNLSDQAIVQGNTIVGNTTAAILSTSDNAVIDGNTIANWGQTTPGAAIQLTTPGDNNLVSNNTFLNGTAQTGLSLISVSTDTNLINGNKGTNVPGLLRALLIGAGGDNNSVIGNEFAGAEITNNGPSSLITNNVASAITGTGATPIVRNNVVAGTFVSGDPNAGNPYDVTAFGVVPDGSDQTANIATALASLAGGPVYFPAGTYGFTGDVLTLTTPNTIIYGDGIGVTILNRLTTSFDNPAIEILIGADNCHVRDLTLTHTGAAAGNSAQVADANNHGIEVESQGCTIKNVRVFGFATGINKITAANTLILDSCAVEATWGNGISCTGIVNIDRVTVLQAGLSGLVLATAGSSRVTNGTLTGCGLRGNPAGLNESVAVQAINLGTTAFNLDIAHVSIDSCFGNGITISASTGTDTGKITFDNVRVRNQQTSTAGGFSGILASSTTLKGLRIVNCDFDTISGDGIALTNLRGVTIEGCRILNTGRTGVRLDEITDVVISRNIFFGCGADGTDAALHVALYFRTYAAATDTKASVSDNVFHAKTWNPQGTGNFEADASAVRTNTLIRVDANAAGVTIFGNRLYFGENTANSQMLISGTDCKIVDNLLHGGKTTAIAINAAAHRALVQRNRIKNVDFATNPNNGWIRTIGANGVVVRENTFTHTSGTGLATSCIAQVNGEARFVDNDTRPGRPDGAGYTMAVSSKCFVKMNARNMGAVLDGSTDDTAALQFMSSLWMATTGYPNVPGYVEIDGWPGANTLTDTETDRMKTRITHDQPQTIADGTTTPNVVAKNNFTCAASAGTIITNFVGGSSGQRITVLTAANWQIAHDPAFILLAGAVNFNPAAARVIELVRRGTLWHEIGRGA